jgi:hypothetical protein
MIRSPHVIVALALCGCAHTLPARLVTGREALGGAWEPVSLEGAAVALHHKDGGSVSASVRCDAADDNASLDVLTRHLVLALEDRKEHERTRTVIDGREALRTRMSARMDGVPVELDLVVLHKDGCVVDAALVSDPDQLTAREPDFDRFLRGLSMRRAK